MGSSCLPVSSGPTAVLRVANNRSTDSTDSTREIGVYMSNNNVGLDPYTADWQVQPNAASFYAELGTRVFRR